MILEPIGYLESCYTQRMAAPRQSLLVEAATATLRFEKKIQPEISLQGLEGFSHLWLIFEFHQNNQKKYSAKVCPPRLNGDSVGVFATRSPHRWNSLGLSLVKIEKILSDRIELSGVDLIDKTPVFDIKPYLPETESVSTAIAGWTEGLSSDRLEVLWPDSLLVELSAQEKRLIGDTLALGPRPAQAKNSPAFTKVYRLKIGEFDVSYQCLDTERLLVKNISK